MASSSEYHYYSDEEELSMEENMQQELKSWHEALNCTWVNTYQQLFLSPEHSDLKIQVKDSVFNAHHCMLSLRTPFFSSASSASRSSIVHLEGHSLGTVWRFLNWCYIGMYWDDPYECWWDFENTYVEKYSKSLLDADDERFAGAEVHIKAYCLAKSVECWDLAQYAAASYKEYWTRKGNWDSKLFLKSAREVYASTTGQELVDDLRTAVVEIAHCKHRNLKKEKEYHDLLMEAGQFAGALVWGYM